MGRQTIQRGSFLSAAALLTGVWGVWMFWEAYDVYRLFTVYESTSWLPLQLVVMGCCYVGAAVGLRKREPVAGVIAVAVGLYLLRLYRDPLPIILNLGVVLMVVCGLRDFRWRSRQRLRRIRNSEGEP